MCGIQRLAFDKYDIFGFYAIDAWMTIKDQFKGNQGSKAPKAPRSVAPTVLSPWTPPITPGTPIVKIKGGIIREPWFP